MHIKYTIEEWKEMKEMFKIVGLPNPKHYPQSFAYYYKVYLLSKYGLQEKSS